MKMNFIKVTFKTRKEAIKAYAAARLSPYSVACSENFVGVGSYDVKPAALVSWFVLNHGGESFSVVNFA